VDVDGHSVGAGNLNDLLKWLGDVLHDVNVLDDLAGHMDVLNHLDFNGSVNVLDHINGMVDDLGLVHGVGSVNINHLHLGNMADLLDLNQLGNVLDNIDRGVNVLNNRNMLDLFNDTGLNLGNMADDLNLAFLHDHLGNVAHDFLYLGHFHELYGDGHVNGHGGLDMLDLRNRDVDNLFTGNSFDDWHIHALFDDLLHGNWAVHNNLTGHVADLLNLNLNGSGYFAMLDNLHSDILVDDLMLRNLNNALHGHGAGNIVGNLDLLDDSLDLHLGNFDNLLDGLLNVLNLWDLNDALLCDDLGNMDNSFLSQDLALNQLSRCSNRCGQ
jgi:hypothetical protein